MRTGGFRVPWGAWGALAQVQGASPGMSAGCPLCAPALPGSRGWCSGWHRVKQQCRGGLSAEILGALLSVLSIWVVTGVLVYLGAQRLLSGDYDIEGGVMLITSACAVAVNIVYVRATRPLPCRAVPSRSLAGPGVSPVPCPQDGGGSAPDGPRAQPRGGRRAAQRQRPRRLRARGGGPAAERRSPHRLLHHLLQGLRGTRGKRGAGSKRGAGDTGTESPDGDLG